MLLRLQRKEGEFWNVKGLNVKGEGSPAATITNATPSNANTSHQVLPASRYDEENAKKQLYIVRQSCLSTAANTLGVGSKKVAPEDVIRTAATYVDFVFNGLQGVESRDHLSPDLDVSLDADFND